MLLNLTNASLLSYKLLVELIRCLGTAIVLNVDHGRLQRRLSKTFLKLQKHINISVLGCVSVKADFEMRDLHCVLSTIGLVIGINCINVEIHWTT